MQPLKTREEAGALIVTFDDPASLNEGRSDSFRESVYELVMNHPDPRVAVDLGPVEYLSSSGVAMLIGLKRRLDGRSGRLVLFQVQPYILDILKVMKLHNYFVIADNEASALSLLSPAPPA